MTGAYVLFLVESGAEDQVLKEAKLIDGVHEANFTYGVYDLIMKVKADSMESLKHLITYRLRAIDNVMSTLTLVLTEE